jgi:hypothetical protein
MKKRYHYVALNPIEPKKRKEGENIHQKIFWLPFNGISETLTDKIVYSDDNFELYSEGRTKMETETDTTSFSLLHLILTA